MHNRAFEVGRIVRSIAGRDKDRYFMVVKIIDKDYVYIADGVIRKLSAPKRKKIKHLEAKDVIIETIVQKSLDGKKIFDSELRKYLEEFSQGEKREEG